MATSLPHDLAREFLVANTFIGSLPDDVITKLMARGQSKTITKGKHLLEQGDVGDTLLVILSGTLKICNIDIDGRETVLNFLRTGDVIGEIAVLDGGLRTAHAIALEASELFILRRDDLVPILHAHPDALFEIIEILCEKLRGTSEIIETHVYSMDVRFAVGLRRLAYLHGRRVPEGITIDLGASQTDLGSYLGLSRANTSRQISKLKTAGILSVQKGILTILDDTALQVIAESVEQ